MNGHLGSVPANNVNIEVQFMERFVEGVSLFHSNNAPHPDIDGICSPI